MQDVSKLVSGSINEVAERSGRVKEDAEISQMNMNEAAALLDRLINAWGNLRG